MPAADTDSCAEGLRVLAKLIAAAIERDDAAKNTDPPRTEDRRRDRRQHTDADRESA